MEIGGGKAGALVVARIKLYLRKYRATVRYFESLDGLGEFCMLRWGENPLHSGFSCRYFLTYLRGFYKTRFWIDCLGKLQGLFKIRLMSWRFSRFRHYQLLIPLAARSKAWVCGRSLAGIVCSNPAGAWMCAYFKCCVLCRRSLFQSTPTECGVSECNLETSTMRRSRSE